MSDIYKYNKSISRFYDAVYEKILNNAGLNFYLDEISNAKGSVLEIGAGTGRIFVPALENGADIYGIDQSESMLEKLKEKISERDFNRVSLQDVREFSLNKKFKLIYAPFRIFSHLISVDDQLKALNKIYEHLDEGGKFIFDVFVPNLKRIAEDEEALDFEGEYEPGKSVKRFVSVKRNPVNQISDITFKFVWDENGKEQSEECSFPMRYYFRYELENLIGRTKLMLDNIYGGFDKSELSNDSKDFVVECIK